MHLANNLWLDDLRKELPESFEDCYVLEMGSRDINGTPRKWFQRCKYIGVDMEHGVGVDIRCKLKDTHFHKDQFDTIISLNCLMHDKEWRESLDHNLKFLKVGGVFICSFGGDVPRNYPDFVDIDKSEFVKVLELNDLEIKDLFFESDRYPLESLTHGDKKGMLNVIARK